MALIRFSCCLGEILGNKLCYDLPMAPSNVTAEAIGREHINTAEKQLFSALR